MVKTAKVQVKTVCKADAALLSVICTGDLAACRAAVDAGKAAASRVGDCVNSNLIARTGDGVDEFITEDIGPLFEPVKAEKAPQSKAKKEQEIAANISVGESIWNWEKSWDRWFPRCVISGCLT